jgi:type III pantothenate kinase
MSEIPVGLAIDLGNTRLKIAKIEHGGRLGEQRGDPVDEDSAWVNAITELDPKGEAPLIAVSSVNPPVAAKLGAWLSARYPPAGTRVMFYHSAKNVPVKNSIRRLETTGADRALAILAAGPILSHLEGWIVSCGTAITVEWIDGQGVWRGGAIAAGTGLLAKALNSGTAQLPLAAIADTPAASGNETQTAIQAGVFWGAVGTVRELLTRQGARLDGSDPIIWTGGDAERLAKHVVGIDARVVPDLVLRGLVAVALDASLSGFVP